MALGAWLGVGLYFTLAVPQTVFALAPAGAVGPMLDRFFGAFYGFTYAAGLVAAVAGWRGRRRGAGLVSVALAIQLAAWQVGLPAVRRAEGTAAFGFWHGLTLGADLLTLALVAAAAWMGRRRPA